MKILVAYFSYTGRTEKVASLICENFSKFKVEFDLVKIQPILNLPYIFWLLLSFVPKLPFPLKKFKLNNVYDIIVLGTPKWTLNCPPVTSFVNFLRSNFKDAKKPKVAFYITYGGFKEDAFIEKFLKIFKANGFDVVEFDKFKRRDIDEGRVLERIENFVRKIFMHLNQSI
jgi:flavodoxin